MFKKELKYRVSLPEKKPLPPRRDYETVEAIQYDYIPSESSESLKSFGSSSSSSISTRAQTKRLKVKHFLCFL